MTNDKRKTISTPIILLSYSLDMSGRFLPYLQKESKGIQQVMRHLSVSDGYKLELIQAEVSEDIWSGFADANGEILIYHYCGHGSQDHLILEGKHDQKIKISAFASFLKEQPSLKLVFLNACLSNKQNKTLLKAGIPYLILTKKEINDEMASSFAIEFYRSLGAFHTVERSFEEAKAKLLSTSRGFLKKKVNELSKEDFPWELYKNPGESAWKLTPNPPRKVRIHRYFLLLIFLVIVSFSSNFLPKISEFSQATQVEKWKTLTDSSSETKEKGGSKPIEKDVNPGVINTQVSIVDANSRIGLAGMKVEILVSNKIIHKTTNQLGTIDLTFAKTMLAGRLRFTVIDPQKTYGPTVIDRYLNKGVIPAIELFKINQ